MRKIALVKLHGFYDDYDYHEKLSPMVQEWVEVTDQEFYKIQDSVRWSNTQTKDHVIALIEHDDGSFLEEVYKNAKTFKDKQEKRREAEEKKKADDKAKREARALARKKKQLDKLKKELEG